MMSRQTRYTLSMTGHHNNVCMELSSFQQNGEFVDMTLAADGHLVKVHQIVMAYASPYFKELIKSANCPHPVIFLNRLSYTSLCSILEYIYTGEAKVSVEDIKDFLQACQSLNIKGLENANLKEETMNTSSDNLFENDEPQHSTDITYAESLGKCDTTDADNTDMENADEQVIAMDDDHSFDVADPIGNQTRIEFVPIKPKPNKQEATIQYTVSNRGALQLILNRYTYFLQYTYKKNDSKRSWRCVDCVRKRCPAYVVTNNDMVVRRIAAHNHPYHDKKILKRSQAGAIFSAVHEAQAVLEAAAAAAASATAASQVVAESSDSSQCEDSKATIVDSWPFFKSPKRRRETAKSLGGLNVLEKLRIEDFRGDSRWYERSGHYYVVTRSRPTSTVLRCAVHGCQARWIQRVKDSDLGEITSNHNHKPYPWIRERNIMFTTLKRRSIEEDTPLIKIYGEEAARHVNAAKHLPYNGVSPSMRMWRKRAQPPTSDTRVATEDVFLGFEVPKDMEVQSTSEAEF